MLEREYKERELMESSPGVMFPSSMVQHAAEYNSYKTAYSPAAAPVEPQPKELCGFLGPNCLDLSVPYPPGSANVELISSNVSVATTYRHYPLQASRGGFVVWPRGAAAANLGDALLYQQCLFNATAVQNMKPGAVWEPKAMPAESQPPEHEAAAAALAPKLEGSRAAGPSEPQRGEAKGGGGVRGGAQCSAFSPPKRSFGQSYTQSPSQVPSKPGKDGAKLPVKLGPFHPLIHQSLSEKGGGGGGGPEPRPPYCKELLEEAARRLRERDSDRYKELVSKPVGTKMASGESLSFSVEAILKRPPPAVSRTFH